MLAKIWALLSSMNDDKPIKLNIYNLVNYVNKFLKIAVKYLDRLQITPTLYLSNSIPIGS